MNTARKRASEYVQKELKDINVEIHKGMVKIQTDGAVASLEWDRLEVLSDLELRSIVLIYIDQVLIDEEQHGGRVRKLIGIFNEQKQAVIKELTGNDFLGGGITGPWDRRSTSIGSNRLAIIRANVKRYEIRELKKIIRMLEQ